MRKKTVLFIILLMFFITTFNISTNATTPYLKVNEGVFLNAHEVNQLTLFGYNNTDEIKEVDNEKLSLMIKSTVLNSFHINKYVKETTTYEDDLLLDKSVSEISKKEYESVIDHQNTKVIDSNGITILNTTNRHFIIDDGGGGGSTSPTKTKIETTEYKHFTLYGVYYSYLGNAGEFHIKTTMEWKTTPVMTYEDIISIAFTNNVQLTDEYYPSKGQYYPKITSKFSYYHDYQNNQLPESSWFTGRLEEINIDGSDISQYEYNINKNYLATKYNLPSSQSWDWGGYYGFDRYYGFKFMLEGTFIPLSTSINAATFAGWHAHQTGFGYFDWGKLTLTTSAPFFSYATNFWVDDPTYDNGIGGNIIFSNL